MGAPTETTSVSEAALEGSVCSSIKSRRFALTGSGDVNHRGRMLQRSEPLSRDVETGSVLDIEHEERTPYLPGDFHCKTGPLRSIQSSAQGEEQGRIAVADIEPEFARPDRRRLFRGAPDIERGRRAAKACLRPNRLSDTSRHTENQARSLRRVRRDRRPSARRK